MKAFCRVLGVTASACAPKVMPVSADRSWFRESTYEVIAAAAHLMQPAGDSAGPVSGQLPVSGTCRVPRVMVDRAHLQTQLLSKPLQALQLQATLDPELGAPQVRPSACSAGTSHCTWSSQTSPCERLLQAAVAAVGDARLAQLNSMLAWGLWSQM